MAVITISREFCSGGGRVARMLAQALGYHFVDRDFIGSVLDTYGLIHFKKDYDANLGFWGSFDDGVKQTMGMLNRVTRSVARHGNAVILGRGSFAVLAGFADVLNVRLTAPFELRVARLMVEDGQLNRAEAESKVRESDAIRSTFLQSVYGLRWDDTSFFDIVVDIGKIRVDDVSAFLISAARGLAGSAPAGPLASESSDADKILDDNVAQMLGCQVMHAR